MMETTESTWRNLNNMAQCDGYGVQFRKALYTRLIYYEEDRIRPDSLLCGAQSTDQDVETRPCKSCNCVGCNRCRLHTTYSHPLQRNNCVAHRILSFFVSDGLHWDFTNVGDDPVYDAGHLPQWSGDKIETQLDTELGLDENIDEVFGSTYQARIECICWFYIRNNNEESLARVSAFSGKLQQLGTLCKCTLRSGYLDEWFCIPCFVGEQGSKESRRRIRAVDNGRCRCGRACKKDHSKRDIAIKQFCTWCRGQVLKLSKRGGARELMEP